MSSQELSEVFSYNYANEEKVVKIQKSCKMGLLEDACKEKLFLFVSHKKSQVRSFNVLLNSL